MLSNSEADLRCTKLTAAVVPILVDFAGAVAFVSGVFNFAFVPVSAKVAYYLLGLILGLFIARARQLSDFCLIANAKALRQMLKD